ncbi:MAG: DUF2007 domain-containing protein [Acidimicrobiia bacterium]|nr:DUF2007 domain-containing protein [Acidimicrobiia bacterium]
MELVEVFMYLDAGEAEIARARLESGGIEAKVFVENLGGEGPRQGRLMVPADDVGEACDVLDLTVPAPIRTSALQRWTVPLLVALLLVAVAGTLAGVTRLF